jgi:pyrroloquinoline quinone biosynthesis protein E
MLTGLNLNKPVYVCAKMTMRCNSRCEHCNIWKMKFDEQELSTADWLSVLNELRTWLGPFRMVFTGGEALLRADMLTILEHAFRLGIIAELLSNGIMINAGLATQISGTGVDQVTISFDGITPEVHDRFRGRTGFHAASKAAVLALADERQKNGFPRRILLKTVISSNNLHELAAIARWAGDHGLEVQYQPIEQNYGEAENPDWFRHSPFWIEDAAQIKEELNALRVLKEQDGKFIANSATDFDRYLHYFESPETLMTSIQAHEGKARKGRCSHAVGNFVMESNGDVRMCFRMEPFGNVRHSSPRDIWRQRKRCWARSCDFR